MGRGGQSSPVKTLSQLDGNLSPMCSPTRRRNSLNRHQLKHVIKIKHDYISNDYFIQYPSIGRGSYGQVFKVTHKITGVVRAAKKIQRQIMTDETDLMKEYSVLKQLQHPNIIKMYEIYREEKYNYIVMEYCDGGELFQRLCQEKRFSEPVAAKFMHQVLYGVAYCHMKGIIHGDLKPENILLDYSADPSQQVKLADFGASQFKSQKRTLIFGTCIYRAPQVFKNKANEKCDVWSCGVMLYNLIVGALPFKFENEAEDQDQIKQQILQGRIDVKNPNYEHTSAEFKDLLKHLMEVDPDRRISAAEALHHKWFSSYVRPAKIPEQEVTDCLSNIRLYCEYSDIEVLCVNHICRFVMDCKEFKKLAPIYKHLDSGLNGVLGKKELLDYIAKYPNNKVKKEDIEQLMERLGKQKDPTITFLQFCQCCYPKLSILTTANIGKLYELIDKKGEGKINTSQLQQCLGGSTGTYERIIKGFKGSGPVELTKQQFQKCVDGT